MWHNVWYDVWLNVLLAAQSHVRYNAWQHVPYNVLRNVC